MPGATQGMFKAQFARVCSTNHPGGVTRGRARVAPGVLSRRVQTATRLSAVASSPLRALAVATLRLGWLEAALHALRVSRLAL